MGGRQRSTPIGHFEYLVMPFGLIKAPAKEEKIQQVRLVLRRLFEKGLFKKAEKFHVPSVSFLGFV